MTRVYKLYANTASSGNAATLTIQGQGLITAISFDLHCTVGSAGLNMARAEVSYNPTGQTTSNDTTGVLAGIGLCSAFTAAGSEMASITKSIADLQIPVNIGDRLNLNVNVNGSQTIEAQAFLYVLQN